MNLSLRTTDLLLNQGFSFSDWRSPRLTVIVCTSILFMTKAQANSDRLRSLNNRKSLYLSVFFQVQDRQVLTVFNPLVKKSIHLQ